MENEKIVIDGDFNVRISELSSVRRRNRKEKTK